LKANAAECPQPAEADITALKGDSGYDPQPTSQLAEMHAVTQYFFTWVSADQSGLLWRWAAYRRKVRLPW
jgi:hypothetical protein